MGQIRGPFPLPQTSPQISGTVNVLELGSGGIYVLPAGNYLLNTGLVTYLQWWDPLAMMWRPFHAHQAALAIGSDGSNYRLVNVSATVAQITIGTAGSGGTDGIGPIETGTSLTFAPPAGGGGAPATAQGYAIIGGSVPIPTIVQPGSRFEVAPVIACDPPPPGGIQATFTCALDAAGNGTIASVAQVNAGAGYVRIPQFYVIPQPRLYQGNVPWPPSEWFHGWEWDRYRHRPWPAPGLIHPLNMWPGSIYEPNLDSRNGAYLIGQPLTGSGTLTGAVLIYYGSGYAAAPAITIAGGALTGAAATAVLAEDATGTALAAATDTSYLQAKVIP